MTATVAGQTEFVEEQIVFAGEQTDWAGQTESGTVHPNIQWTLYLYHELRLEMVWGGLTLE